MLTVGWRQSWVAAGALCCAATGLHAQGIVIGFSEAHYYARPLEPITVEVRFHSLLPVGLFSYGLRLALPPGMAVPLRTTDISVPAELDFNGVNGPGALRHTASDWAGVKGTVDFFASPPASYMRQVLATFRFLPDKFGDYLLDLAAYRTLGPTESVFVAADGRVLDADLRFGSAVFHVVPEPGPGWLLGGGLALTLWWVKRSREGRSGIDPANRQRFFACLFAHR